MSISISGDGTFTGVSTNYSFDQSVSVGGTVTYEDVTNVDSIGVITARNGIEVTGGNVHIAGVGATIGVTTAYISSINDLNYPSAGPLSNRNIVINGAMQVAQRGNTVSNITSGTTYPTADRYRFDVSMGTWTADRMTNSQGDTYESGATERFRNSLRMTCTTGQASPGATDDVKVVYFIEGQDVQHLDYGTTNAKTMTLSFWVRSTKTGTGTLELIQEDNSDRQFSASYTINATNTWEYKTITIPGDTSGLINNDTGRGLDLIWWLNSGSTFTGGSQGGWRTLVNNNRNSDNLAIGSANDDEWFLTGVQLEIGERATPFEHRSYSDELERCWRYYQRFNYTDSQYQQITILTVPGTSSAAVGRGPIYWHKEMRATPDCDNSAASTFRWNGGGLADQQAGSISIDQVSRISANINCTDSTSRTRTSGFSGWLSRENFDTTWIEADAEL